jgi:hypothetical protein
MLMTQERETPNAVSFIIELPSTTTTAEPEIKKRLENAPFGTQVSLEQINAKLEKAEEKRKLALTHQNSDEKAKRVFERKSTLEKAAFEKNSQFESNLTIAEQRREQAEAAKIAKVQEHLSKVDQVRK